jgi:predicted HicB family RNase H-like nuclease
MGAMTLKISSGVSKQENRGKKNEQRYLDNRREEEIIEMQKEIDMDLRVRMTESQYEALKTVAEASGDTLDEYLHSCVIQGIESDIDLYFGHSKAIKEKLYKQVGDKDG